MELKHRTVLITGGATGIGFALAKQLTQRGNQVVVCGRSLEKLQRARSVLPGLGILQCDLNSAGDRDKLLDALSERYPQLDTLINNAGIQTEMDLTAAENRDAEIDRELDSNLGSHIKLTCQLYPALKSRPSPAILFVSSALGIVPKFNSPVYSAAKAGLHSYVQSLRAQVEPEGMRVHEIFPDVVDTPMTQHRTREMKMTADQFAEEVMRQLDRDRNEIFVGRTRLLNFMQRSFPRLALQVMNKHRLQ